MKSTENCPQYRLYSSSVHSPIYSSIDRSIGMSSEKGFPESRSSFVCCKVRPISSQTGIKFILEVVTAVCAGQESAHTPKARRELPSVKMRSARVFHHLSPSFSPPLHRPPCPNLSFYNKAKNGPTHEKQLSSKGLISFWSKTIVGCCHAVQ